MAEREITAGEGRIGFRLQGYVWRSKPTVSPLTGRPVRCVVGQDENGGFRAATRIGNGEGHAFQIDFAREQFANKDEAIQASREITRSYLTADAEIYAGQVTGKQPGEEIVRVEMDDGWHMSINEAMKPEIQDEKSGRASGKPRAWHLPPSERDGAPDIKSLSWEGPEIKTDAGRTIFGVVGQTHSGMLRAGYGDLERVYGYGPDGFYDVIEYEWSKETHKELGHAIFAARREVQNQQSYDRAEPERLGPEHGRRPAEILLARATTPRSDKAELKSLARDRSRSIDR